MTQHAHGARPGSYANGNDEDDPDRPGLTRDERIDIIVNRSLAVFQQMGELHAASIRSQEAAVKCEMAMRQAGEYVKRTDEHVRRTEAAAVRIEQAVERIPTGGYTPPQGIYRHRLESLLSVSEDDTTKVRSMKESVAAELTEKQVMQAKLEELQKAEDKRKARAEFMVGALKIAGLAIPVLAAIGGTAYYVVTLINRVSGHG